MTNLMISMRKSLYPQKGREPSPAHPHCHPPLPRHQLHLRDRLRHRQYEPLQPLQLPKPRVHLRLRQLMMTRQTNAPWQPSPAHSQENENKSRKGVKADLTQSNINSATNPKNFTAGTKVCESQNFLPNWHSQAWQRKVRQDKCTCTQIPAAPTSMLPPRQRILLRAPIKSLRSPEEALATAAEPAPRIHVDFQPELHYQVLCTTGPRLTQSLAATRQSVQERRTRSRLLIPTHLAILSTCTHTCI